MAEDDRPRDSAMAATIAKWLLPSVTVMFGIVGYIVQSAQQDMLGIGADGSESATYFISTSDFLSETAMTAMSASAIAASLASHPVLLPIAVLGVLFVLLAPRVPPLARAWRPALVPLLLVLLLAGKFVLLDMPLSRLDNLVLGDARKSVADQLLGVGPQSMTATTVGADGRPAGWMASKVFDLRSSILCRRISAQMARERPSLAGIPRCGRGDLYNRNQLAGEYIVHLWMIGLIVTLSIFLLRGSQRESHSARTMVVALLGLAYTLSLPYAYGKLMRSTSFDYGIVRWAPPVAGADETPPRAELKALILSRSAAGASLLAAQSDPCSGPDPNAETVSVARMWIAASKLVSIEQIYRTDVVIWSTTQVRPCPSLPSL